MGAKAQARKALAKNRQAIERGDYRRSQKPNTWRRKTRRK
jgi:hypothetical protein